MDLRLHSRDLVRKHPVSPSLARFSDAPITSDALLFMNIKLGYEQIVPMIRRIEQDFQS